MTARHLDRRRLVRRHNPVLTSAHPTGVLTVGNGDAALSVDVTGLQTFARFHELVPDPHRTPPSGVEGLPEHRVRPHDPDDFQIPLRTQTTWSWYETRATRPFRLDDAATIHPTSRGHVPYLDRMGLQRAGDPIPDDLAAGAWFHYNPRRTHLGRLALLDPDGVSPDDPRAVQHVHTELDLWTGRVRAAFELHGHRVDVETVADPDHPRFAVRVVSTLLTHGWGVGWVFDPQPDDLAPFEMALRETTTWTRRGPSHWHARRVVESTAYGVEVLTSGTLQPTPGTDGAAAGSRSGALEVVLTLHPDQDEHRAPNGDPTQDRDRDRAGPAASFPQVKAAAGRWWERFWTTGAVVSLEGSSDPRAQELERRIVLSQYLTAVNSCGATPPAETGLTYNTWTGKFHLEMHWWHGAHFPLWRRGHLLERSLTWYHGALASARATARQQGYRGARWPKQTDVSARESPSNIGVFLIWQQPHLIHLLELLRIEGRDETFLRRHYPLVEATADFMADFVQEEDGCFTLPPPLVPAQESYVSDRDTNADPTFELAYWAWALRVADDWRRRLGLPERSDWSRVSRRMRAPTVLPDGTYAAIATPPHLIRKDHPSMLMALGWLPQTDLVDAGTMSRTLEAVIEGWDRQSSWGWDYPVLAMTAARLGDLGGALEALLLASPKNEYLPNGHNPQMPGFLSLYLPANGGLLAAVAHIAAAIEEGAQVPQGWTVTAQGFSPVHESTHRTAVVG